jgi:hypothetical protein
MKKAYVTSAAMGLCSCQLVSGLSRSMSVQTRKLRQSWNTPQPAKKAQPGDHPALLVYRTEPLLPLCGRGVGN